MYSILWHAGTSCQSKLSYYSEGQSVPWASALFLELLHYSDFKWLCLTSVQSHSGYFFRNMSLVSSMNDLMSWAMRLWFMKSFWTKSWHKGTNVNALSVRILAANISSFLYFYVVLLFSAISSCWSTAQEHALYDQEVVGSNLASSQPIPFLDRKSLKLFELVFVRVVFRAFKTSLVFSRLQ